MGVPLFGQEHVDRYRETDGEEGHDWQGTTVLLVTTTGRNSGAKRTTPLIYQRHYRLLREHSERATTTSKGMPLARFGNMDRCPHASRRSASTTGISPPF